MSFYWGRGLKFWYKKVTEFGEVGVQVWARGKKWPPLKSRGGVGLPPTGGWASARTREAAGAQSGRRLNRPRLLCRP